MKNEVEEFLRRVAQLRAQAEAQARGQPPEPAPTPKRPTRVRPVPEPALPPSPPPAGAVPPMVPEVVDAELADEGDRFARRVAQDLAGSAEIAERVRHLGEEVDLADDKLEAHLRQVFDHQLGHLKQSAAKAAGTPIGETLPEGTATGLLHMLRSPQSVRDAIILSEVLKRPEW